MKTGELYDLAKQANNAITKRLFTKFYNMAIEQISEEIRIDLVDEEYDDDSFSDIPQSAVMIESVSTTNTERWAIVDNELVFYDENNDPKAEVEGLRIKWWRRVSNAINDITYYPSLANGELRIDTGAVTVYKGDYDKQIVLLEDIEDDDGDVIVASGSVCMLEKSFAFYVYDSENYNSRTAQSLTSAADAIIDYHLLSDKWEEQDDGFDDDVQICAVYVLIAQLADITGLGAEEAKAMAGRAKQWLSRLRRKYNASKTYQSFVQVPF